MTARAGEVGRSVAALGRPLRPMLLAVSVVLGACGDINCWDCGKAIGFRNTTDQAVDVVWSDERSASSPKRLEPGQHKDNYSAGGIPARGNLRALFITVRATDTSGTVVFCQRMSWREFIDRESLTIDIVRGDLRC